MSARLRVDRGGLHGAAPRTTEPFFPGPPRPQQQGNAE